MPAATDFTVMVGSDPSRAISSVAVKGSAVTLMLATRVRGERGGDGQLQARHQ